LGIFVIPFFSMQSFLARYFYLTIQVDNHLDSSQIPLGKLTCMISATFKSSPNLFGAVGRPKLSGLLATDT